LGFRDWEEGTEGEISAAHGSKFRILLLLSLPPTSASSGCLTLTLTLTLTPKRSTFSFADIIHLSDLSLRRLGSRKLALRVCTILLQSLQDIPTCTLFSPLHRTCSYKEGINSIQEQCPGMEMRNRNCQIFPALNSTQPGYYYGSIVCNQILQPFAYVFIHFST